MRKYPLYISILCSAFLASCSMMSEFDDADAVNHIEHISSIQKKRVDLNFYAKEMTHDLLSNINHVKPNSSIVTTSFIFVDGDYQNSPIFARQLQESFSYEFHRIGQPVIEVKSTGYVRVTPQGDFGLSVDFTELNPLHSIDYILVGTLAKTIEGVQVNAKLVGAKSHAIVAAAQQFIPQRYIDTFVSSKPKKKVEVKVINPVYKATKIKLIKGEG